MVVQPRPAVGDESYYALLGVSPSATLIEIKRAYHKLALETHPDRVGHTDKEATGERFKKVGVAYEVLGDARKRHEYDLEMMGGGGGVATPGSKPSRRTPRQSPKTSPRFPHAEGGLNPGEAPPPYCRMELIAAILASVLVLLLVSNRQPPPSHTHFRHPIPTTAPPEAGGVSISGACPATASSIDGRYLSMGTLLGRQWYRSPATGSILYYDTSCSSSGKSPAGWFILDTEDDKQEATPSFGGGCGTTARIVWDGSQLPFGTETWEMACEDNKPTRVPLTISRL